MLNNAKKLLKQGALVFPMVALLSGCGGLDGDSDKTSTASAAQGGSAADQLVRVSGGAVKGVIAQGLVTAYRLVEDDNGRYSIGRAVNDPVRTNADGQFDLNLRGEREGWILVELTADDRTRMTCDVVPSCQVAGAGTVPFGETFALDEAFSLRGAVNLADHDTVYLTPLSQLAVGLAEQNTGGLSGQALSAAYQDVESWFGLERGTLLLPPPDLTRLDEVHAGADEVQLAVVNAAFLAVANEPGWGSITAVLNDMMNQVEQRGYLGRLGNGVNVSLSTIAEKSALQASKLQMEVESSLVSQTLAIVQRRNYRQFEEVVKNAISDPRPEQVIVDSGSVPGRDTGGNGGRLPGAQNGSHGAGTGNGTIGSGGFQSGGTVDQAPSVAANAAHLSWQPPMLRENGNSLSMAELTGYVIVYGQSPEAMTRTLEIEDAYVMESTIEDLTNGTWYFAIRSVDSEGRQSQLSEVVSKTVNI